MERLKVLKRLVSGFHLSILQKWDVNHHRPDPGILKEFPEPAVVATNDGKSKMLGDDLSS